MFRTFLFYSLLSLTVHADELRLVQFTDIHGGGPHFSQAAFESACKEGLASKPQALLLTGDHCDNSHDKAGFQQRYSQSLALWQKPLEKFQGELFFALGNDDFQQNYQSEPADLRASWQDGQKAFGSRYYLNELGNGRSPSQLGGFCWLTLNSQIFSSQNRTPQAPEQAKASLEWLRTQLESCQEAQPVVLLSHIAPSWDLYSRKPGWKTEYLRELADIMNNYPGQVLILSGHFHRNHVQGMRPERPIPILTTGALATKYGYQPNWREYRWDYEKGVRVDQLDYQLHYPGHPEWLAKFSLRPDHLQEFADSLTNKVDFYKNYVKNIYGNHKDWPSYADDSSLKQAVLDEFWVEVEGQ